MLANSSAGEWNCDVLDDDQLKRALKGVLELQEQFHVQAQERLAAEREPRRKESSAGLELRNFEVGDYVLYARVRRPGVTPKLMATWKLVRGGWLVLTIRISLRSRTLFLVCLLYTSPSPRDQRGSRMPSSA